MNTEQAVRPRLETIRVEDVTVYASRLAVLILTVAFAVAYAANVTPSLETQMMLYLVGMVALNLPHGGYEHLSNLRHRGLPFGARYVAMYLTAVGAFVAFFFLAPIPALALAFATAIAKGGHGDLRVMDALVGTDHLRHPLQRALAALVRGGAIMVVPLALWRDTYIAFSSFMISVFDPAKVGPLVERIEFGAPLLLGAYGLALLGHIAGGYLTAEETGPWLLDAGETLLLVAYFLVVPVVISIGLYFPLWYSLRQSGRSTMLHRESPADQEGLPMPAVWAAFIGGALATGTLAALLWWLVPNPLGAATLVPGLVAFYTIFVCIIALPHVVVGDWLDRGRGIWYVP